MNGDGETDTKWDTLRSTGALSSLTAVKRTTGLNLFAVFLFSY